MYLRDIAGFALSTAFHLGLMQEMNEYLSVQTHDCKKDNVLFQTGYLHLTDCEYNELLQNIAGLLKPYADREPGSGLSLRKLSIISSPPDTDVYAAKAAEGSKYEIT